MLIAYAYCYGTAQGPELCIIPAKPDQFSCMVRINTLIPTIAAACRLSPTEGIKVFPDVDKNAFVVESMIPSKMYLTPSQPDRPGLEVRQVRVVNKGNNLCDLFYKQNEKETEWKLWRPNEALI
jgi:hypothetical protein